jgi:chemotaxis protein CheD
MLPEDKSAGQSSWMEGPGALATRYGSFAMERLINELLKLGAQRDRFEVKLFGGGRILSSMTDVGAKNIRFVREFLKLEGFSVAAEDMGATCPRHVDYFPATGRVMLKRLKSLGVRTVADEEARYNKRLSEPAPQDDVELFN